MMEKAEQAVEDPAACHERWSLLFMIYGATILVAAAAFFVLASGYMNLTAKIEATAAKLAGTPVATPAADGKATAGAAANGAAANGAAANGGGAHDGVEPDAPPPDVTAL